MERSPPGLVPDGLVQGQTAAAAASSSAAPAAAPASSESTEHARILKRWEALRAFESISSACSWWPGQES
eukprot:5815312-Prorocentrum_lima.AAC.1